MEIKRLNVDKKLDDVKSVRMTSNKLDEIKNLNFNFNDVQNYKWITFNEIPSKGKTKIWNIQNKENLYIIGQIKWYGPWRKYCFFPTNDTIFETDCLSDIVSFLKEEIQKYKENKKLESK